MYEYDKQTVNSDIVLEMMAEKKASRIIRPTEKENIEVKKVKKMLLEKFNIFLS